MTLLAIVCVRSQCLPPLYALQRAVDAGDVVVSAALAAGHPHRQLGGYELSSNTYLTGC